MSIRYDFAAVSARIVDHLLRKDRRDKVSRLNRRLQPADRAAIYLSLNRHAQGVYLSVLTSREFASLLINLDGDARLPLVRQRNASR